MLMFTEKAWKIEKYNKFMETYCELKSQFYDCSNDHKLDKANASSQTLRNIFQDASDFICGFPQKIEPYKLDGSNCFEEREKQLDVCVRQTFETFNKTFIKDECWRADKFVTCALKELKTCYNQTSADLFNTTFDDYHRQVPCGSYYKNEAFKGNHSVINLVITNFGMFITVNFIAKFMSE